MTQRHLKRQPVQVHTWDGDEDAMRAFAPDQVIGFAAGNVSMRVPLADIAFPPGTLFLKIAGYPGALNFSPVSGVSWEEVLLEPEDVP